MAFSSIIMLPLLLLFLAIWAGLIYLLILLIRALRISGDEDGDSAPASTAMAIM